MFPHLTVFENVAYGLRKEMQIELRRIQRSTGITTIMVTHDQEEAMTMSDAILIMNHGVVQQEGSPFEVYEHPANSFVAGFLGKANMCPVVPAENGRVESTAWFRKVGVPLWFVPEKGTGAGPIACIRPEKITLTTEPHEGSATSTLRDVVYAGLLWKELEAELGADRATAILGRAYRAFGQHAGAQWEGVCDAQTALLAQCSPGGYAVFQQQLGEVSPRCACKTFGACPHVEQLRKLGATDEEVRILCQDVLSEGDYGNLDPHDGISLAFDKQIGAGDDECVYRLTFDA